jgi:hypothetical protein
MKSFLTAALRPRCFFLIFAATLLSGCPSDGERNSTFPKGEPIVLSGIVATGAPQAGASITVKGSSGFTRTTITDAGGKFSVRINQLNPPFVIEALLADGITHLHSVVFAPGNANVTLLTELVVFQLLQQDTKVFFENLGEPGGTNTSVFTPAALAEATTQLQSVLGERFAFSIPPGAGDVFTTVFQPVAGDPMDDAISALQVALSTAGLDVTTYKQAALAENDRCSREKVVLTSGAKVVNFCPVSKDTIIDSVDFSRTTFTFTNALGDALTVRQRATVIESIELLSAGVRSFGCTGAGCSGITVSDIAADGTRQLRFDSVPGTDVSGAAAILQGTLRASKAGLPPLACDGDKIFLTKSDGSILSGCFSGGFGGSGGDHTIVTVDIADDEGSSLFAVEIRSRDQEIVSASAYRFDPDTSEQIVDFKCIAMGCNGVTIGPLSDEDTRTFSLTDTLLLQVAVDGTPTGPGLATLNTAFTASVSPRIDQVTCVGTTQAATLTLVGERAVTVCPFPGFTNVDTVGFYVDEARTQIQHGFSNSSREDFENSIFLTIESGIVKELVFSVGFAQFGCKGTDCAGVNLSALNTEGKRNVTFSAVQLRERDAGGLTGARGAQLTGNVLTVTSDCIEFNDCPP